MITHFKNALLILHHCGRVLYKRPALLMPLLLCWAIYAPLVIFLAFFADVSHVPPAIALAGIICVPIIMQFLLALAQGVMMRMIEDFENARRISLFSSLKETLSSNSPQLMIIGLYAGILHFVVIVFEAVLSPASAGLPDKFRSFSLENVVRVLFSFSGGGTPISALKFVFLKKAIRITMFMSIPALIWDKKKSFHAFERGLYVMDRNLVELLTGFLVMVFIGALMHMPAGYMLAAHDMEQIVLTQADWISLIIYSAFTWSLIIYLEQMFCIILFKWQQNREALGHDARLSEAALPQIAGINPDEKKII